MKVEYLESVTKKLIEIKMKRSGLFCPIDKHKLYEAYQDDIDEKDVQPECMFFCKKCKFSFTIIEEPEYFKEVTQ